jgi:hypothetical protein
MLNVLRHPSSLVDKDAAAQPRAARMGGSLVSFLLTNIPFLVKKSWVCRALPFFPARDIPLG